MYDEDKKELETLYQDYPELLKIFKNFIDTPVKTSYNRERNKQYVYSLEKIRSEMIDYNLLLDSHRNTSFFEVFPMYKKYLRS